jgi:hypothetical protein
MGIVISLVLAELTLIVATGLSVTAAVKKCSGGEMYTIISAVVSSVGFLIAMLVAIFLV